MPIGVDEGKADRPLSRAVAALRPWSAGYKPSGGSSPAPGFTSTFTQGFITVALRGSKDS